MQMHTRTFTRPRRVMAWLAGSALVVAMAATAWATFRASPTPTRATASAPGSGVVRTSDEASAFIARWGAEAKARYGVAPADWRRSLSGAFADADARTWAEARAAKTLPTALAALTRTAAPAPISVADAAAAMPELELTVIAPCRLADTRITSSPLDAEGTRTFMTTSYNIFQQGGDDGGCGIATATPVAVLVNVTAVLPSRAGFATLYAPDEPRPLAAAINYAAGAIVNNTVAVKVDASVAGRPFALYSYSGADYVIDIVGYYTQPAATQSRMDCYNGQIQRYAPSGFEFFYGTAPLCDAGYTAVSAHCQSYGSVAPGREGEIALDWEINGLMNANLGSRTETWTLCMGNETTPRELGGGSVVMVFERCCRAVEEVPPAP